jgi:hypothetical protein
MRPTITSTVALAVFHFSLAACVPTQHLLAPYRHDATLASRLEKRAVTYCRGVQPDGDAPPRPFKTDGCSCWWNDGWADCCVEHDIRYWCGGPRELRGAADAELRRCVAADHSEVVAFLMYLGTRLFAASWAPAGWRWGYGWRWPRAGPAAPAEADAGPTPPDEGTTARRSADTSCEAACLSRDGPLVDRTPFGSGGESPPRGPGSPPGLGGAPAPWGEAVRRTRH